MEIVLIIWAICGLLGLLVSLGKPRSPLHLGFGLIAFLLGPIALLIALSGSD